MALPKFDRDGESAEQPVTDLAEAVRRARRGERVVVRGDEDAVAVAISLADLRRLQEDDHRRAEAVEVLMEFSRHFSDRDPSEIEREAVKAVREVRAEMWAERPRRGEG